MDVIGNEALDESFVHSTARPPGRKVWSRIPPTAEWAAIFLDAELYIERVDALGVLKQLETSRTIPPVAALFVSNDGAAARHTDYICNPDYGAFLSQDVISWARNHYPQGAWAKTIVVGLSLSGLAAAHVAVAQPNQFQGAILQSPSLWWNNEHFRSSLPRAASIPNARLWVSVGDAERDCNISHQPSGMFQGSSQIDACGRACTSLESAGHCVHYRVFTGGHDPACWRDDLAIALPWIASGIVGAPF